jgi:hypothetical protein
MASHAFARSRRTLRHGRNIGPSTRDSAHASARRIVGGTGTVRSAFAVFVPRRCTIDPTTSMSSRARTDSDHRAPVATMNTTCAALSWDRTLQSPTRSKGARALVLGLYVSSSSGITASTSRR